MKKNLEEICIEFHVEESEVLHFLEEEWVIPIEVETLSFDEEDLARIGIIKDLRDELEVNEEGIGIILNLLDQIHALKAEIRRLKESSSDS